MNFGALILLVCGYLLGLIVLLAGSLRSKNLRVVLLFYILAPAAWIALEWIMLNWQNTKVLAEREAGMRANEQAFSQYCKSRQRRLLATASLDTIREEGDRAVFVRFEDNFTGNRTEFNAGAIANYLQLDQRRCAQTGLLALEGQYEGAYVEGKGYTPYIRLYDACTKGQGKAVPSASARYELILGETGKKDALPWGSQRDQWMSHTSVRIVDRKDSRTLAEDTMYFFRYDSGDGGCPRAGEQLAELLSDVFKLPER